MRGRNHAINIVTAGGRLADVPDVLVSRLLTVAGALGLRPADLEEAVHDCCEYAAERAFGTEAASAPESGGCEGHPDPRPTADGALESRQRRIFERFHAVAERVNGGGLTAQIAFLAHHHGTERDTTALLADVAGRHRPMAGAG